MAGKRRRSRPGQGTEGDSKRPRLSGACNGKDPVVRTALLAQYYPQVFSLREYLISKLPPTSKIRRKKILSVGRRPQWGVGEHDQTLADILDNTLVGVSKYNAVSPEERLKQWSSFSQCLDTSESNLTNLGGTGVFSQSEVGITPLSSLDGLSETHSLTPLTDR